MNKMFCYQCEQTLQCKGCTQAGVCGKDAETAALQDLLRALTMGLSQYAHRARQLGKTCDELNRITFEALFTTVTNVNFDAEKVDEFCTKVASKLVRAAELYNAACTENNVQPDQLSEYAHIKLAPTRDERVAQGRHFGVDVRIEKLGADAAGVHELIIDGIKGLAAYADHAAVLGYSNDTIAEYVHRALSRLAESPTDLNELLELALDCGHANILAMELLDKANTTTYGNPEPTAVSITPKKGKCILVSGHDLHDLAKLLDQTEGKGINVYTHGEMLPCNAYPQLKKYKHLAGHYGTAWQNQQTEFAKFPGAILMTTNCIQKPRSEYVDRIFTTGLVEFPGVKHVKNDHFAPVIEAALACEGYAEDAPVDKKIMIGFGHHAVKGVAPAVVDAIKAGKIRHFFLIGGCDGAKPGRNYYTEFAEKVPKDCVILTLACGKFRFNTLDFGDIGGIPRLLDCGQCNDAYSAVLIATMLAEAFKCEINELPLSLILSWYEQKAAAVLLSLLALGIKNIKLGPTLPAFVTPAILDVLVKNFDIAPITTADDDLKSILG